jgi:hypothetical protein
VSGDAREQTSTFTHACCYRLLRKRLTDLVPTCYGYHNAFVSSRLITLFHTVQRNSFAEDKAIQILASAKVFPCNPASTPLIIRPTLLLDSTDVMPTFLARDASCLSMYIEQSTNLVFGCFSRI